MLLIIQDHRQLDYGQLMTVYEEANREKGAVLYPRCDTAEQLFQAEQELYGYLRDVLRDRHTVLAVWAPEGKYQSALRLEPYRDGLLVTALETAPSIRHKGHATALLRAVQEQYRTIRLYSHIARNNVPSIRVHEKCGFRLTMDYAILLDGSVSSTIYTYIYEA